MPISEAELDRFLDNPSDYFGWHKDKFLGVPKALREELHLRGMQRRFKQFRHAVPMLARLADNQNVNSVNSIDDVLPLLFDHATYKSYPASLLENSNFVQLTKWLGKLTTHDLTNVDVSACRSIDDWMRTMKRDTPLGIVHTSGTSGSMSFIPVSKNDYLRGMMSWIPLYFGTNGNKPALPLNIPSIYPYFRHGGSAMIRGLDCMVELIAGSEENFHACYPTYQSADVMLLAARQRAAAAKGKLDSLKVSPELVTRRAEFEELMKNMPEYSAKFFERMCSDLAGKRVYVFATSNLLYPMASTGLKKGARKLFAPNSVICTGGGGKGMVLPDDWQEPVKEFFGVERLNLGYGMSEMCGSQIVQCPHGHYHPAPNIIPFLLDPDTSQLLPRKGSHTGRFAFYDLVPNDSWGGFITADLVTMEWEAPCPSGWSAPYIGGGISRITDQKNDGGEEKINCAATPTAYADALDFLKEAA